ncbi:MAG TPA: MerR family transcriptional regulator [Dermatophilaceae bacterium]|nr:MerR family transcriptional regulator [Dermatophilaceae bacterium]
MNHENEAGVLRIGELSRRVGVSEHVLRAWESRYGLLSPARSNGGFRLYSEDDENRVRRMQAHLADGLAAAQAASAAIADDQPGSISHRARAVIDAAPQADLAERATSLRQSLDEMDEPAAQAVLDRLFTDFTVETVFRDVLMPYLHELGARWAQGAVSVGQEHFASHVVRGRLTGLARGWGNGRGPQALLACPPDESHDLALLVFGIVLNRRGWRVRYLGASTPLPDMIRVTAQTRPSLVVLAATTPERFAAVLPELSTLAEMAPLVLAGAGATTELAQSVGARVLSGDPVTAAENLVGSLS